MLEMKNPMRNRVESITNRLDQSEERLLGIEDKVEEMLYSDSNKEKNV
jgi:hypothetical protein